MMTRTALLAISAIAALGTTCLGASAFDRDGRAPGARTESRPAVGGSGVGVAGDGTAVVVGGTAVSVGGGKGPGVIVGGDGTSIIIGGGVSVGGGKGTGVVVGGNGATVSVGGTAVSVGGGNGAGAVAGGDGVSVVVGGNGVSVGGGRGTGVVVGGTSVVVGGDGVTVRAGSGAGVVVGGNGTAVSAGGATVSVGGNGASVIVGSNGTAVGAGVVVAPGLAPRVVTQTPGFKAIALGWNNDGAWVARTSPTLDIASADALQICNSQFGGCTLSDARVAPTGFGCLVVAQSDDGDRVFAATGNSPDAARAAVATQITSAGLQGHIAYTACNF